VVYASVFAALLPHAFSVAFAIVILLAVFLIETGWYALVAFALSAEKPRSVYLGHKAMADRATGAVLVVLGLKLLTSAHRA